MSFTWKARDSIKEDAAGAACFLRSSIFSRRAFLKSRRCSSVSSVNEALCKKRGEGAWLSWSLCMIRLEASLAPDSSAELEDEALISTPSGMLVSRLYPGEVKALAS